VLEAGAVAVVPTTPFTHGDRVLGPGLGLDLRAGYYVTSHVGILGGMRLSRHIVNGCSDCNGLGFNVPVVVQVAASRTRGIYGEAGVGLVSIYAVSRGDVTARASTPVVLKLGAGYRLGGSGSSTLERQMSADLHVGVDLGRMTSFSVDAGKSTASASIDDPMLHVVAGVGLIGHFAL